tara:strand:+ start:612 stop:1076 length:465 start_codon:yes stop_codon:yes gene_type:complete
MLTFSITSMMWKLLLIYLIYQILTITELKPAEILACLVCILHIIIWGFVLLAFVNKRAARFNIYYLIPGMYLIHLLPFHILQEAKSYLMKHNESAKEKLQTKIFDLLVIPSIFIKLITKLESICTFSPISPQGMMVFGMISGLFKLYPQIPSLK